MNLPRAPRTGEKVDAAWGARIVDYLRAMTLRSGPNYRVKTGPGGTTLDIAPRGRGGSSAALPGSLQVSTQRPPGTTAPWDDDPEAEPPLHVWVWWGLVGDKIPDNINEPVAIPAAAGNYWVYVEADIDQTIMHNMLPLEITAARIKLSSLNAKPTQAPPNLATGNPPEKGIYLLAQVTVGAASQITAINNTGSGSIGAYVYTQDLFFRAPVPATEQTEAVDAGMVALKNLTWYRS